MARHQIDPEALARARERVAQGYSVADMDEAVTVPPIVRRVLMTTTVVGSAAALTGGLIWGAALLWRHHALQVLLLVLAALVGVGVVGAGRWVFERSWRSPWLLLGPLPAVIAAWILLVR